jgi:hypothetical protein
LPEAMGVMLTVAPRSQPDPQLSPEAFVSADYAQDGMVELKCRGDNR